eukprot:Hpha_TRINITY_DN1812_c0_g1::TRINITY_DN1812_c0_g1_i1::g.170536::m.170536/K06147/ABCB-BAC; ATP-binding cassette, subfamily B, bacterial
MGGPNEDVMDVAASPAAQKLFFAVMFVECVQVFLLWGVGEDFAADFHPYSVRTGHVDVVIFAGLRVVLLGLLWFRMRPLLLFVVVALSFILAVSKAIAAEWHPSHRPIVARLLLATVVVTTTMHLFLCRSVVSGTRKKVPTLKYVLVILRPYFLPKGCINKVRAVLTWVAIIGAKVCNIYIPLLMGDVVSDLTDRKSATSNIALYCGVALLAKGLKELQNVVYVKVKQVAFVEMASHVFKHVHELSLEWHLRKKMGTVIRAMDRGTSAADSIVTYLFLYLIPTILECIVTFAIFSAHFKKPELASVCFLSFTVYILLTSLLTAWRRRFREGMNQHDNDYHTKFTDSLINFETVKYFTSEERELEGFVSSVKGYQKYGVVIQLTLSLLNFSQQCIIYSCTFVSLYIASRGVLDGSLKVGDFVAISGYVMQMFTPLTFLGSIYDTVVLAFVNMQHLADLLGEHPDVQDRPGAEALTLTGSPDEDDDDEHQGGADDHKAPLLGGHSSVQEEPVTVVVPGAERAAGPLPRVPISFQNVCFKYPSADSGAGLRDISIQVGAGEKVAIVGETGCGKTTLSRLLFRFYDLKEGAIYVNGQNINHVTQKSLRKVIGIVPQDTVLFNDTLRNNVMYGRSDAPEEVFLKAAADAQLLSVIERLPNGWDTQVGERGLRLSGGEKQRVAIARCLLKNPPIIVLDEATSALDSTTEREILEVMQCLRGRTLLVIAHRLSTIQDADRIVVIKNGEISEEGDHHSLRRAGGIYDSMWRIQEDAMDPGAVTPESHST